MSHLVIRFFGGFRLSVGQTPVAVPSDFPTELFAYLVHHIGLPLNRSDIAAEFWPDFDEAAFDEALAWFGGRKRRFGKTDEQLAQEQ